MLAYTLTHTHIIPTLTHILPRGLGFPYNNESLLSFNSIIHGVIACVNMHVWEAGIILAECVPTIGAEGRLSWSEEINHVLMVASMFGKVQLGVRNSRRR